MLILAFWLSLLFLVYIYLGFPLLVMLRARLLRKSYRANPHTPSVSVLIAAHNEQACIQERVENLLAQDYPSALLEILVASDGSEDRTCEVVAEMAYLNVQVLKLPRIGKAAALNAAANVARGEVLVFTDANTHFRTDALRQLVQPLVDEQVGAVAGHQIYTSNHEFSAASDGEQMYWNYDRWLKAAQSAAGNVTSATGAIYAIRRALYQPVPPFVMDDFVISTGVVEQGFRLVFSPNAVALEPVAANAQAEYERKVRVAHQGLAAVLFRRRLLNPLRYGWYSWQLLSHKVLRRLAIVPLLVLMVANAMLLEAGNLFQIAFAIQAVFYFLAAVPLVSKSNALAQSRVFTLPYFFCLANVAAGVAAWRLLRGQRLGQWEPERHQPQLPANLSSPSI